MDFIIKIKYDSGDNYKLYKNYSYLFYNKSLRLDGDLNGFFCKMYNFLNRSS